MIDLVKLMASCRWHAKSLSTPGDENANLIGEVGPLVPWLISGPQINRNGDLLFYLFGGLYHEDGSKQTWCQKYP